MQIKITYHSHDIDWFRHTLALTPQQQQQVEQIRSRNPGIDDQHILDLMDICPYTVITEGQRIDRGHRWDDCVIENIEIAQGPK